MWSFFFIFPNFSNANQIITASLHEKFFLTDTNRRAMQNLGYKINDFVVDYLSELNKRKVFVGKSYQEINEIFKKYEILGDSQSLSSVFEQINTIADNSIFLNNKYIGHMFTTALFFPILINSVIDAMNFDMSSDNVSNFVCGIEEQTINWLTEIMGYEIPTIKTKGIPVSGGIITNGGTIANLKAFLIIRNKYLASRGIDLTLDGLLSLPKDQKLIVFVSKDAHYSWKKIGGYVGLGSDSIVEVDVDEDFRMDINDLKDKIQQAKQDGAAILGIIANAGSTGVGSIDPLEEIAALARENNIWFHVDAAYGGACALTQRHKELKKAMYAIRLADSITLDPHKLLYIPYNLGSLLVKRRSNLCYIKGIEDIEDVKLLGEAIQQPRRFDAFKLWITLKFMGIDNLSNLIDYTINMTFYMRELLKNAEDFENLSNPQMNIFVFRYVPKYLKKELDLAIANKDCKKIEDINKQLNELTVEIQKALQKKGGTWLSYTIIGKSKYNKYSENKKNLNNNITVFRLCLMNPFIDPQTLNESFLTIRQIAEKVAKVKEPIVELPQIPFISTEILKGVDSFRKYFANLDNKEEVRKIGKSVIDIITCSRPNNKIIDLDFQERVPKMSSPTEYVLSILQGVYEDSFKFKKDKFVDIPFISILGSSVFAAFNQNQIVFETSPASTIIENKLVHSLAELVGYKSFMIKERTSNVLIKSGGIVTNGLSPSLLTMLLVARNKLFQQKQDDKKGVTKIGLRIAAQDDDLVFITSKSQESKMKELANIVGFGLQRIIIVDEVNGNTNIDALMEQIYISKKLNKTILALDIFISNIETLDMVKLKQLCEFEEIFINITLTKNSREILNKEKSFREELADVADSMVLDLPDWFNMPYGIGIILFKDHDILESYLKQSAPYCLRQAESSVMCNIGSYSIEGSKGFQAFQLWIALQYMGVDTYKQFYNSPIDLQIT